MKLIFILGCEGKFPQEMENIHRKHLVELVR